jgi:ComF family protein
VLVRAWNATIDLLFPARCYGCGAFRTFLCGSCAAGMAPATGPGRCPHCSAAWDGGGNCPRCFHLQGLDGVRAAFEMEGTPRRLVHALKYEYVRALAPLMAAHIAPLAAELHLDAAFPVPLHPSRQRERGFNQAEVLRRAAGLALATGELRRSRRTDRQVGMHLGERRSNVSGAFAYTGPRLDGLTVAIVDDVVTTGATVNECALVLREHGAARVYAIAFTRASYRPETTEPIED